MSKPTSTEMCNFHVHKVIYIEAAGLVKITIFVFFILNDLDSTQSKLSLGLTQSLKLTFKHLLIKYPNI